MDFEKFIEQDIVEFLDRIVDRVREVETPGMLREEEIGVFNLSRDYAEDAAESLHRGKLDEARQVYLDLRREYDSFSPGSGDKRKAFQILEEIYRKVQQHIRAMPESNDRPDRPEDLGISLPKKEKPMTYQERRSEQIDQLKQEKKRKDQLVGQIRKDLERIERLLQKDDAVAAVVLYRHAKDLFREIPKRFYKEKKDLYDELIASYYQIRKASGTMQGIPEMGPEPERSQEPAGEDDSQEARPQEEVFGEEMMAGIEELRQLIEDRKPREGFDKYKEVKKMFADFQAEEDVKEEVFKDIVSLYRNLRKMEDYMAERRQNPVSAEPAIKPAEEPGVDEQIRKAKLKAYKYLDNEDTESASIQYHKLKELFEDYPDDRADEKKRLYREILDIHDQIVEKRKLVLKGGPEPGGFRDDIQRISNMIEQDKIEEARKEYIELQQKASDFRDKEKKEEFYSSLDAIKSKLNAASARPIKA